MINNTNILISGAGISGLTLAYWLQPWGLFAHRHRKRANLDQRGYVIDFYRSGFDVAEKMNLLKTLQAQSNQYPIIKLIFIDRRGKPHATQHDNDA